MGRIFNYRKLLRFSSYDLGGIYWPTKYHAIDARNWTEKQAEAVLRHAQPPIIVVISKQDLFDHLDSLKKALHKRRAQLVASPCAFSIYKVLR